MANVRVAGIRLTAAAGSNLEQRPEKKKQEATDMQKGRGR